MNLPVDFITRTGGLLGEGQFAAFRETLAKEPPVSIRMNRLKTDAVPAGGRQVPWCGSGYYLASRPTFTFDPLFHAGCYCRSGRKVYAGTFGLARRKPAGGE